MRFIKLAMFLACFCSLTAAQTTTTFTGTIKDLTGSAVSSGNVTFTLQPGADTTISGSSRFTPQTVTCGINGSGLVKANDLTNPCVVTNNTAQQPAGTSYKVQICPSFACTSSFVTYALGGSVDITTAIPTPAQMPAYSLVDIFQNQSIGGNKTFTGSEAFSGAVTITGTPFNYTNHNNHCVAGPGATPTIDQAVTLCASLTGGPVVVDISAGYTGVESVNLFTTSLGYKVYTGANNVTVVDYRANSNFATAPIYSCVFGGRIAGQLNRNGCSYYAHSPSDSSTGITSFNWLDGIWPSNAGLQAGTINVIALHDTQVVGSSLTEINAVDGEVHLDATSADNPVWSAFSYGGAVLISRSGVTQDALETSVFRPKGCNNQSPTTAKIYYCYGINLDAQPSGSSGGVYRSFSLHSRGDALWENGTKQWSSSADPTATISTATEVGQTATFTMTTTCAANPTLVAGALIGVSGVSVAGYNSQWIINSAGCSGSSFSVFAEGTSGLGAGSGGTVQSTTPRVVTNFRFDNVIVNTPLANASGWRWQTQAAADLLVLNSGVAQFGVNATPLAAGAQGLGVNSLPWGFAYIGNLPTNNYLFNPVNPSQAITININDPGKASVSLPLMIANGTAVMTTAAITAGNCGTTVTVAATGVLATDTIKWSFNAAPAGSNAGLVSWPTAGNVNFAYCPNTAETPAAATINWRVSR